MTETVTQEVTMTEGVRDFSRPRSIKFRLDHLDGTPETFYAVPGLPALLMVEFVTALDGMDENDIGKQAEVFTRIFNLLLVDESAVRFVARMSDKSDPIALDQVMEITNWIMEQYGMRPIKPSEPSSSQSPSPDGGTNSAEDVSLPESPSNNSSAQSSLISSTAT